MNASAQTKEPPGDETPKADLQSLFKELSCSPEGLDSAEAKKRLEQHGPNALEEKTESALLKFLGFLWGRFRG
ncbi:MAG TPA: cation-transporting P-type ATPase [Alphaproteobacteria bacterium]|nr:cation-transporting P-type ATPase [Alphaproteobacteria bacterium]